MKTLNTYFVFALSALFLLSCSDDDDFTPQPDGPNYNIPTPAAMNLLFDNSLDAITQHAQFNAEDGISFTSDAGTNLYIPANCLTLNGDMLTGEVDLEFVEFYERASMATSNKPLMGVRPNGDKAALQTGGQFFVQAFQNGEPLEMDCLSSMNVPGDLTNGVENDMTLWTGVMNENGDLEWNENEAEEQGGVFAEENTYYVSFGDFGWTNIDRFWGDPRPKTTLQVQVPAGFDSVNSVIYLSYDDEPNVLAKLDIFDEEANLFTEHYGEIPIGLEIHLIFVTEDNGEYRYSTQGVTVEADDLYTIDIDNTTTGNKAELEAAIEALP
ncbi:MAG: hypothetical protein L0J45_02180 [Psychroflexus sp.]|nr:hypothetical protein [Psychroflexus sp.]MDN6309678.1 hypothetical protein [Psychroflexus sp.]